MFLVALLNVALPPRFSSLPPPPPTRSEIQPVRSALRLSRFDLLRMLDCSVRRRAAAAAAEPGGGRGVVGGRLWEWERSVGREWDSEGVGVGWRDVVERASVARSWARMPVSAPCVGQSIARRRRKGKKVEKRTHRDESARVETPLDVPPNFLPLAFGMALDPPALDFVERGLGGPRLGDVLLHRCEVRLDGGDFVGREGGKEGGVECEGWLEEGLGEEARGCVCLEGGEQVLYAAGRIKLGTQ